MELVTACYHRAVAFGEFVHTYGAGLFVNYLILDDDSGFRLWFLDLGNRRDRCCGCSLNGPKVSWAEWCTVGATEFFWQSPDIIHCALSGLHSAKHHNLGDHDILDELSGFHVFVSREIPELRWVVSLGDQVIFPEHSLADSTGTHLDNLAHYRIRLAVVLHVYVAEIAVPRRRIHLDDRAMSTSMTRAPTQSAKSGPCARSSGSASGRRNGGGEGNTDRHAVILFADLLCVLFWLHPENVGEIRFNFLRFFTCSEK